MPNNHTQTHTHLQFVSTSLKCIVDESRIFQVIILYFYEHYYCFKHNIVTQHILKKVAEIQIIAVIREKSTTNIQKNALKLN